MAQFYAEIQGNRGKASRMGTKSSGMWCHIRGWDVGIRIDLEHVNGRDRLTVSRTGGSHSPYPVEILAQVDE